MSSQVRHVPGSLSAAGGGSLSDKLEAPVPHCPIPPPSGDGDRATRSSTRRPIDAPAQSSKGKEDS
jgi:hypothetical protein